MPDAADRSLLVDAWVVPDGSQDEFLAALTELFERLRGLDGFLEGAILQGVDVTHFVSFARMRSERDREEAYLDSEVQAISRRIGALAPPQMHAYSLLRSFAPAQR